MAHLPHDTFLDVVRHAPLVSVDLLVSDADGRILLGYRRNRPARQSWFVPGGRINKDERLCAAFARITAAELGQARSIDEAGFLGVTEHLYPDNFADAPNVSTHYVVLPFALDQGDPETMPQDQHEGYRWLSPEDLLRDPEVHPNTQAYFRQAGATAHLYPPQAWGSLPRRI